jgi:hypothetical protein
MLRDGKNHNLTQVPSATRGTPAFSSELLCHHTKKKMARKLVTNGGKMQLPA